MKVAMLAPMPSELKPITKALSLQPESSGAGVPLHRGRAGNVDIVAMRTGMGLAAAARAAERILDLGDIDRLVVVGIAGSVDDRYEIGDVLQPEVVIDGASGTELRPAALGTRIAPGGVLWTSDEFNSDPDHVGRLAAKGVTALDMETAAIGAVCDARGTPWSVFRSISDRVTDGIVGEEVFALANPDGSPNLGRSVRYIARHPQQLPRLVGIARDALKAANAAAREAVAAIRETS
jgi:adenosylhomocysteine nucleosidase